jgi:hypothetical protein
VLIRRDAEGRYCLNDLHKAAGGEEKSRPNQFLRIDQTVALIAEIETAQMCAVKTTAGRNGGTYVVKQLVYSYAMWVSPSFVARKYPVTNFRHGSALRRFKNDIPEISRDDSVLAYLLNHGVARGVAKYYLLESGNSRLVTVD